MSRNPALLASTFLSNLGLLWAPADHRAGHAVRGGGAGAAALAVGVAWRRWQPAPGRLRHRLRRARAVVGPGGVRGRRRRADLARPGRGVRRGRGAEPVRLAARAVLDRCAGRDTARAADRACARAAAAVAAAVLVFSAQSVPLATQAVGEEPAQRLLATAVRLDAADSFGARFQRPDEVIPRLKALGRLPVQRPVFPRLRRPAAGRQVDVAGVRPVSARAGRIDTDQLTSTPGTCAAGWSARSRSTASCSSTGPARSSAAARTASRGRTSAGTAARRRTKRGVAGHHAGRGTGRPRGLRVRQTATDRWPRGAEPGRDSAVRARWASEDRTGGPGMHTRGRELENHLGGVDARRYRAYQLSLVGARTSAGPCSRWAPVSATSARCSPGHGDWS